MRTTGLFLVAVFLCCYLRTASAINCYQCDSNVDLECNEEFDEDTTKLRPLPCDHIHQARFCTKTTGMYAGRIGTIRNCSSRDLGDYCSYIDRPGDIRYTRSCIYTCSRNGCNTGHSVRLSSSCLAAVALVASLSLLYRLL